MSLINITLMLYVITFIAYVAREIWRYRVLKVASLGMFISAFGFNLVLVIKRSVEAGHPPFSNLYESLIFYACCTAFVYIVFEFIYNFRIVGTMASVLTLLILSYATLQDDTIRPIMPALKSNWMLVHVITYMLGYGAFGIAFVTSIIFLVTKPFTKKTKDKKSFDEEGKEILPGNFDRLSYKIVAFGFPFLTLGMVTGAVWAKKAWGDYWSWDPKETWSLITWFAYLVYLHTPLVLPKMNINKSKASVILACWLLVSFGIVNFTFMGLNYLPSAADSEHIYGAK
ncbi:MAG: c-type cytochrome biogenesis protein CcsB [Candidatus Loosdrechtia sp.]|uniref:c-type cytochrome biogenesis protein CcsB n=1 Tax=Candidatus Loosdrechtia sp. TaxID=3101272 RepID=UPI003A62FA67|nr:MAG: c-type cytochrome biogenesis protein CcsB [Candidatus Jettenia sp. AMX2]